jgi:hypothetical protein
MLLSIARVPSENSGQNVPPAVGEPVADVMAMSAL